VSDPGFRRLTPYAKFEGKYRPFGLYIFWSVHAAYSMKGRIVMKKTIKWFGIIALAAVIGFTMAACGEIDPPTEWEPDFAYTTLSLNQWGNGSFTLQQKEQWFNFTATSGTQYIHIKYGTIDRALYVEPYNKKGEKIANAEYLTDNQKKSFVVTNGEVHFIKVYPYNDTSTGTFQIAFTNTEVSPDTLAGMATAKPLNAGTWAEGSFSSVKQVEWFQFTANAAAGTQRIHIKYGTIDRAVYIHLHNTSGMPVENQEYLTDNGKTQPTVTNGQTYYIKVYPFNEGSTGTFRIAFNNSDIAPANP
jgi:hypothetical protein